LELKAAGVELGKTYPKPMVDHATAREKALAAFQSLKETA
jgi:deoxyribodipyrimidine photo-lyase